MRRRSSQLPSANARSAGRAHASARPPQSCASDCPSGRFGAGSWRPREAHRCRQPALHRTAHSLLALGGSDRAAPKEPRA
eukprot:7289569-Alexandrium_andersonii.AAC.1